LITWSPSVTSHWVLSWREGPDSHPASAITNTPSWNISATTVQWAIDELESEKELISNKENSVLDNSTSKFPTNNLVKSYVDQKNYEDFNSLNIVDEWQVDMLWRI
jgi:hypothetical protein